MSKWIRNYKPSEIDADEWGNILVLRENGQKAVYHWQNYNEHYAIDGETAWMTLPQSDIPQPITITIRSGGRSFTIEMVGSNIEVHDSHDPMGQPIICGNVDDIDGVLLVVESILADHIMGAPDDDEDCGCESVAVNDTVLQGFIDALRGNETASVPASKPKPWQKNRGK